jgi:hypothetical protein
MDKLVEFRDQITKRMEAGGTFEQMEVLIESSPLSKDEKSALWLFAWSYLPGVKQRTKSIEASQMLAETYDAEDAVDDSGQRLAEVMEAVREHEDRTRSRAAPRRPADDWLYKRVRRALESNR